MVTIATSTNENSYGPIVTGFIENNQCYRVPNITVLYRIGIEFLDGTGLYDGMVTTDNAGNYTIDTSAVQLGDIPPDTLFTAKHIKLYIPQTQGSLTVTNGENPRVVYFIDEDPAYFERFLIIGQSSFPTNVSIRGKVQEREALGGTTFLNNIRVQLEARGSPGKWGSDSLSGELWHIVATTTSGGFGDYTFAVNAVGGEQLRINITDGYEYLYQVVPSQPDGHTLSALQICEVKANGGTLPGSFNFELTRNPFGGTSGSGDFSIPSDTGGFFDLVSLEHVYNPLNPNYIPTNPGALVDPAAHRLTGVVRDKDTGEPIPNAKISLNRGDSKITNNPVAFTGLDGRYESWFKVSAAGAGLSVDLIDTTIEDFISAEPNDPAIYDFDQLSSLREPGPRLGNFETLVSDFYVTTGTIIGGGDPDDEEVNPVLTTTTYTNGGVIKQPGCLDPITFLQVGKGKDESCVYSGFKAGDSVNITAVADIGYHITGWSFLGPSATPFVGDTGTGSVVSILMPSEDVTISVSFAKDPVRITYSVNDGSGYITSHNQDIIRFSSPDVGSFDTNEPEVQFTAVPDSNWKRNWWRVDNTTLVGTPDSITVSTQNVTSINVVISFRQETLAECDTNELVINVEGNGSVSGESGFYCDFEEKILNPISSNGYFFKEWIYNDSTIVLDGTSLKFDMSVSRTVTAVFEKISGYTVEDYSLFYCPSTVSRTNTIDFSYSNLDPNPSIFDNFHFRATFYSDPEKTKVLYSAFSLSDNKRWFYNDGSFKQIPIGGVFIEDNEAMDITYSPEILPVDSSERQKEESLSDNAIEFHLICGTRYYVDIEAYSQGMEDLTFIKSVSLIVNCDDVDSFKSYKNNDENNWICSGQGNSDLLVTDDIGQSLFPAISSNHFGIFNIAWQSRRGSANTVYSAMWDSNNDLLYSSGQGQYDTKIFNNGFKPIVITDPSSSFYVSSYLAEGINYYYCPIPIEDSDAPQGDGVDGEDNTRLCYPGHETKLNSTIDDIKIRVYEEDTDDNLVINKDKVIPIVNKTAIRLDIDGASAVYAIRLRDSADTNWSSWINIDTELNKEEGEDETISDYRISDSRIIVPWTLDRINGVRRVCVQLLTLYGISPTICTDIFMNIDIIQYVFKFYNAEKMEDIDEVPIYNGLPIVSQTRDATGLVIGNDNGASVNNITDTTIYFKVLFSEDIIINDTYNGAPYTDKKDFTFNMVQQGIDDIWGGVLERFKEGEVGSKVDSNKTFTGSFKIYQHDGVFNKDGKAFIQVILSNSIGSTICLSSKTDPYNLMLNSNAAGKLHDLVPEEVFNQYKTSQIGKVLDTVDFKQYYRVDDDNFRFGNPDFFRNDQQGQVNG